MKRSYDLIVVGAGMAGLLAARAAAEHGLNVALVEKRRDPTIMTRACGETIVAANEMFFGDIVVLNRRDARISFPVNGFSMPYDGRTRNMYSWHFATPEGHIIEFGESREQKKLGDRGRVGLAFEKEALSRCLLAECEALHVDIFTGVAVDTVEVTPEKVAVGDSRRLFSASYCIAADGVNSSVAKAAGFNQGREFYGTLRGISTYMDNTTPSNPDVVVTSHAFIGDIGGLFFMVPRATEGNSLVIVLSMDPRANISALHRRFLKRTWIAPWFHKANESKRLSAICNCYSPITEPYRNRILITGDAGSSQELENTGAMISGWRAGKAVAEALSEEFIGQKAEGIQRYAEWWKQTYIQGLSYEIYMKSWALPFVLTSEDDINGVFNRIEGPLRPCYNAYTSPLTDGLRKAAPVIIKERPELWQKMMRNRLPCRELFADIAATSKPV